VQWYVNERIVTEKKRGIEEEVQRREGNRTSDLSDVFGWGEEAVRRVQDEHAPCRQRGNASGET
jgi:hypothetical protein